MMGGFRGGVVALLCWVFLYFIIMMLQCDVLCLSLHIQENSSVCCD